MPFPLGGIFFSSITFSSSASGNLSFMCFQSKLLALQTSASLLCTLLGHQGLAGDPRQTPAPARIFLEWSFLLVSDNFPSFSDIVMPLKRKIFFCISSSILSALNQEVSPDSFCQKQTIYIFTHLEFIFICGVRQRSKNSATIFTVPPFSSDVVSLNHFFFSAACSSLMWESLFPDQGRTWAAAWRALILPTRPPGNSLSQFFFHVLTTQLCLIFNIFAIFSLFFFFFFFFFCLF